MSTEQQKPQINYYDCSPPGQHGFPYTPDQSKDLTDEDMDSVQQWIDEQVTKGFLRPATECKTQSQMNAEVHANINAAPSIGWKRSPAKRPINVHEHPVQTKKEEQEEDKMYAEWAERTQSQMRAQFLANSRIDRQ